MGRSRGLGGPSHRRGGGRGRRRSGDGRRRRRRVRVRVVLVKQRFRPAAVQEQAHAADLEERALGPAIAGAVEWRDGDAGGHVLVDRSSRSSFFPFFLVCPLIRAALYSRSSSSSSSSKRCFSMPWRHCLRHSGREHHARQRREKKRKEEVKTNALISTTLTVNLRKMSPPPTGPPLPLHKSFAASAIAACSAEFLTLPLDTAKVRLQIQPTTSRATAAATAAASTSSTTATTTRAAAPFRPKYSGLIGTIRTVAAEEGAASLWKGLVPSMHRQVLYGGEGKEMR